MSATSTIQQIDAAAAQYAPAALAGVLAVEQAAKGLPGETKSAIVVSTIMAGAQAAQNVPVPRVQGIAALVSVITTILNAAGVFGHGAPAPSAGPPSSAPAAGS